MSLTTFGEVLRALRQKSHDPERPKRPLSQSRLGALIGQTMDDRGFTGAAVSDWERGQSRINAEDRNVLVALIKVLYRCGGIKNYRDANELLEAGNYRALNTKEIQAVFGFIAVEDGFESSGVNENISKPWIFLLLQRFLSISDVEFQNLLDEAERGPAPSWPRVLAALMRKASERILLTPRTVLWIGVWWLAWWLVTPSLRWPFATRAMALQAIGMYIVGTLIIPLLIGALVNTEHDEYWKAQGLAHSRLLRLYTYQGAGIGFNLGYFFVLPLGLIVYYLNLGPSSVLDFSAATLALILGNMSARVVPHNLWRAYKRLHFADGAIFFVVALLGPLWGLFFLEYYSILLMPFWGGMLILVAFMLTILITIHQSKKVNPKQTQP